METSCGPAGAPGAMASRRKLQIADRGNLVRDRVRRQMAGAADFEGRTAFAASSFQETSDRKRHWNHRLAVPLCRTNFGSGARGWLTGARRTHRSASDSSSKRTATDLGLARDRWLQGADLNFYSSRVPMSCSRKVNRLRKSR